VPAGVFTDAAGNDNAAATEKTITVDTVAPEVTVSSNVASVATGATAIISFTLSEASTDFVLNDVVVTGGTIASFEVDSTNDRLYTATFTPDPDFVGAATITVPAAAFTDTNGNDNTEGAVSLAVNTVAPTVAITSSATTLGSDDTAVISFVLSADSVDFAEADISPTGGTLSGFSGSGSTYSVIFTPTADSTTPGQISVAEDKFEDADTNKNLAGALATAITIDTVAPTTTIGNPSPASIGIGETSTVSITLGKPSTDFAIGDIAVAGGSLSDFVAVSSTVYTVVFTPDADSTTSGTINVPAGVFTDAAGNDNAAATEKTITVDTVAPEVTVSSNVASVATGATAIISFTLSEASTDFVLNDVVVTGGTIASFEVDSTNDRLYTATFTPDPDFVGAATITVPAAAFTDTNGNDNTEGAVSLAVNTDCPNSRNHIKCNNTRK